MRHLPSPLPGHDLATIIHHAVVDSLAVLGNTLLLLAVLLKSPKSLGSYKVLLVNSAIVDILSSFSMLMTMTRIVPTYPALAYVYVGVCAHVSGIFCSVLFTILIATCSQSLFLIALSFFYRLYILGRPPPSNKAVSFVCLLASIPNLIILVTYTFALDESEAIRAQMRSLRPEYALDEYVVEGHVSIFNAFTLFMLLALTTPSGPTLVVIYFVRKRMLAKLTAHSVQMSGRTAEIHRTLAKVLTLQSLLPVFFIGSVVSYGLCQFDIVCSPVQEHFIAESVSFIAMFSPMITLYCMQPYIEFAWSIFACKTMERKASSSERSTTKVRAMQNDRVS